MFSKIKLMIIGSKFQQIFTPNILKLLGFIFIFIGQLAKIIISKGKYIIDPFGLGITVMAFGSITNFNPNGDPCHQNGIMFRLMSIFILTKLMSQPILSWLNKDKNDEEKNKDRDKYMATNILKCLGFAFVMFGAWSQYTLCKGNLLSDPFPIGVTAMCIAMLLYTVGLVDSWVPYQTMNFFIITKFISHVTHAGHSELDVWGIKHDNKEFYNKITLKNIVNKTSQAVEKAAQGASQAVEDVAQGATKIVYDVTKPTPVESPTPVEPPTKVEPPSKVEPSQNGGYVFRGYNNLI